MENMNENYMKIFMQKKVEKEDMDSFFSRKDSLLGQDKELKKLYLELSHLKKEVEEKAKEIVIRSNIFHTEDTVPYEKTIILQYTDKNNNYFYFDYPSGNKVEEEIDNRNGNYTIINLQTKSGDICIPGGYIFSMGSVLVKVYHYQIKAAGCSLSLVDEILCGVLHNQNSSLNNSNTSRYVEPLKQFPANFFVNTMFGVNHDFGDTTLERIKSWYRCNQAFETILKTIQNDLLCKKLLARIINENGPMHKILGFSKKLYNMAVQENLVFELLDLEQFIKSDFFNLKEEEWIDCIKEYEGQKENLDFFNISYSYWRYGGSTVENAKIMFNLCKHYESKECLRKYYSFRKFAKYVLSGTLDQGYTSLTTFIDQLDDYLRMCDAQLSKPILYSAYLSQTHDICSRNHKIIVEAHQEEIFKNRYKDFKDYKTRDGKFMIIHPRESKDVKNEGDALSHCVGSYIKRIIDGTTLICFLRKNLSESLITMEINNGKICQVRGACNRDPNNDERKAIQEFADARKLACAY